MSRVEAAAPDRLPWLSDEEMPKLQRRRRGSVTIGVGTLFLLAAAGMWIGTTSGKETASAPSQQARPTTTIRLPPPQAPAPEIQIVPQPEVALPPAPQVRPEPNRQVHIAPPSPAANKESKARDQEEQAPPQSVPNKIVTVTRTPAAVAPAPTPFVLPKPWPPRVIKGAAGRIVQVGAFGSIHQAKRGWWFMVRAYPAMAHLPAVVRVTRNSKGRGFYRFQIGTTSQAHSEVLCQRMLKIGLSCAVVGLPWKAKVER